MSHDVTQSGWVRCYWPRLFDLVRRIRDDGDLDFSFVYHTTHDEVRCMAHVEAYFTLRSRREPRNRKRALAALRKHASESTHFVTFEYPSNERLLMAALSALRIGLSAVAELHMNQWLFVLDEEGRRQFCDALESALVNRAKTHPHEFSRRAREALCSIERES